ncbi:Serine/threonine-protein kinase RIO1 [Nymphon striatum]|nr:Serine/threonine-protein kinase RIO1 [Nymphon striatum]
METLGQFEDAEIDQKNDKAFDNIRKQVYVNDGNESSDDLIEEDDDYDDFDFQESTMMYNTVNKNKINDHDVINSKKFQPRNILGFEHKINFDSYKAINKVIRFDGATHSHRNNDKANRATAEQVLDERTKMILFKFLNGGFITEINGCISTGKEANVYHATGKETFDMAIKIFKTSILVFKSRDKYVTGDFRRGYCKHNPRKMVGTWAEKEMRNLLRIYKSGIPCPKPLRLKSNILVMEFIGSNGYPSPKLKDGKISEAKAKILYKECIILMRKLYQVAKLVHADLSEFNILLHEGKLVLIDVSQSVEAVSPQALVFLRKDCENISNFFSKKNVEVLTLSDLFDFITDDNINDDKIEEHIEKAQERALQILHENQKDESVNEEVFKHAFIPQNLDQVKPEDIKNELLCRSLLGLKISKADEGPNKELEDKELAEELSEESSDESTSDESSSEERKRAIKEDQKEKRKHKIPKSVKKRKQKLSNANRGK